MGKGSAPTIGYKYFMGLHIGMCHGPVNSANMIRAGGRTAWIGNVTSNDSIYINATDLFGGDTKEGGLQGYFDFMFGADDQTPNAYLQRTEGLQQPAYLGLMTGVFEQGEVCSLNPYLKPWQFQLSRTTAGWSTGDAWYPEKATVVVPVENDVYDDTEYTTDSSGTSGDPDSDDFNPNNPESPYYNFAQASNVNCENPAHIVYECVTNTDWGLGYPVADIDDAAFRTAADTMFAEGLGLCIVWTQQDQIDKFVQSIMNHIGGVFVVNPQTGLYQLKLLRQDYTVSDLIVLDTSNIQKFKFERATPVNMVNEVQVQYINANSGKVHKTPPAQNNANIENAGGIISQAKDYPGIPSGALAFRLALRDLATQGTPLSRLTITANRGAAATLTPGDVFVLNWPPLGLESIVYRVGEIDYGTLAEGSINITAIEDVFGLPAGGYAVIQQSQWLAYDTTPKAVTRQLALESSYRDLVKEITAKEAATTASTSAYAGLLALRPNSISLNYDLWSGLSGNPYKYSGGGDFCPFGELATALVQEYTSTVVVNSGVDLDLVPIGSACMVGSEKCIVTAISGSASSVTLTLGRGADDTPPLAWAAGTVVFFYDSGYGVDTVEYAAGETWDAKALTRTSAAVLAIASAPASTLALVGRQNMPLAPGMLTVNASAYPTSLMGALTLVWAHRNRLTQLETLVPTGSGSITPEDGTTYTVKVYLDGALDSTTAGIVGTTVVVHPSDNGTVLIQIFAVRGGVSSYAPLTANFDYVIAPASNRVTNSDDQRVVNGGNRRVVST